ncbi:ATPase [Brevibacillus choshinensis]|uniref:ATPase n=1 Tax=Brevibacillus choshinensis TaxID=54911 RepID=A0ABR5N4B3_BRECH|nr:MFS transporter [Brevibacillus choshinensis]KQL45490.1 ATPase [Brevibacillus choshinensis]
MTTQPVTNSLWRNRSFVRLWCGTILSALADSAFFILLSWFIVDVTGSEAMLGTTLICMSIPRLLFMLVGGVAADRWSRKWIMFSSILARGVILVVFSLLLLDEGGGWLPISAYVIAVLFGTVDAFFWPARSSILPFLVTRDQLAPANSMMEISQQISMVGGPLVSALLIRTTHYPVMFMILGVAFFAGTLFILSLRLQPAVTNHEPNDPAKESTPATSSYFKDIFSGIRFTFSVPILSIIFVTSLFTNMTFSGPINMGLPLLVKNLGWDGSAYSSLSITLGIGTITGGIITGLLHGFRGKFLLLPFFLAVMGFAVSSLFFMQHISLGFAAMFTIGLMLSITNIPYITYIQSIVPAHMLGRVMSLLSLMSIGLGPVSYAICSFVLEHNVATPAVIMLTGGLGLALISMSLWLFREVRRMEQHPAWARPTEVNPSRSLSS